MKIEEASGNSIIERTISIEGGGKKLEVYRGLERVHKNIGRDS